MQFECLGSSKLTASSWAYESACATHRLYDRYKGTVEANLRFSTACKWESMPRRQYTLRAAEANDDASFKMVTLRAALPGQPIHLLMLCMGCGAFVIADIIGLMGRHDELVEARRWTKLRNELHGYLAARIRDAEYVSNDPTFRAVSPITDGYGVVHGRYVVCIDARSYQKGRQAAIAFQPYPKSST